MTPLELDPPILVEDGRGLEALLEDLDRQDEIAVDTEADSFYSYREKVCLVQITCEDRDYLVDPLADFDMAPFGRILADPSKTKVFHDSEYDVLILKREYGFDFAGLFDTRVAAAALGMEAPGLASVLREHFDIELDKSMQRSDWARRPLSEKQVAYARLDTHFLLPLMHALQKELGERGRTMIVDGECRRLELLQPTMPVFNADEFVKVKGARTLSPIERRALSELFNLREKLAEKWDAPPFRVMNNRLLIDLSTSRPRTQKKLLQTHGFTQRMARRLAEPVLAAISKASELGPMDRLPSLPKRDGTAGFGEEELDLYDRLKRFRKSVAEEHGIESSYLLNRHVMARIAQERPTELPALERVEGTLDWQLEMFGEGLVGVVQEFERAVLAGEVPRRSWKKKRG